MIRRLLNLLPHDTLFIGGEPYMRRWYLVGYAPGDLDAPVGSRGNSRAGWWWNLGRAARIHETLKSDDSRAFHDHPWPWISIGLRGSYTEVVPAATWSRAGETTSATDVDNPHNPRRTFTAPFLNHKSATDLHVLTVERGPVWTLFLTGRKVRTWGFAGSFGWLPWRSFDDVYPERDAWTEPGT